MRRNRGACSKSASLFPLGQIAASPNALRKLSKKDIRDGICRHAQGEWGMLDSGDQHANEYALRKGGRLLSCYQSAAGVKFWIITKPDRSKTTVLLPDDY